MIRTLLASTAIATVTLAGAHAATTTGAADRFLPNIGDAALASQLIGETVYSSAADDAETIGEVNDLIVGADGEVDAALIGVGGFLGVGEKNVAVTYDSLNITTDNDGDRVVVLETSREELEAAPAFDTAMMEPDAQADRTAVAPGDTTAQAPLTTTPSDTATPAVPPRDSLETVDIGTISTDNVIGATIYSADDQNVGEVSEVVMTADGEIDAVVIDVGGFLGIGAKPVAVAFGDLDFRADNNGTVYVYTAFSREQLEAAADYNKDTYEQNRDAMLLRSN